MKNIEILNNICICRLNFSGNGKYFKRYTNQCKARLNNKNVSPYLLNIRLQLSKRFVMPISDTYSGSQTKVYCKCKIGTHCKTFYFQYISFKYSHCALIG